MKKTQNQKFFQSKHVKNSSSILHLKKNKDKYIYYNLTSYNKDNY